MGVSFQNPGLKAVQCLSALAAVEERGGPWGTCVYGMTDASLVEALFKPKAWLVGETMGVLHE